MTTCYDLPEPTAVPGELPMPAAILPNGWTVVASGEWEWEKWSTEEKRVVDAGVTYGILAVDPTAPGSFYRVVELDPTDLTVLHDHGTEGNIVPATTLFDDTFGFWGGA